MSKTMSISIFLFKDEEEDGISSCEEQTQPVKSLGTSEVESENLSESDIDPFETMYGEMDEDSFHQMMEGNDWTYYPLFSDKEFLNEDWHKYTCIESCAAISEKLMTQVVHWYLK